MAHRPGDDPTRRVIPALPEVPRSRQPVGYRPGLQVEERLQGVLLVVVGVLGLLFVSTVMANGGFVGAPRPPEPPPALRGMPTVPIVNATTLLMPLIAVGSVGLILVGLRRIVSP